MRGLLRRATVALANFAGVAAIAQGGTGATSAGDARTNLGLGSAALLVGVASKWTPTLTNVANIDASANYECLYARLGSIVFFAGRVDLNPTLPAVKTQLGISLPVASNFGAAEDAAGVAFCPEISGEGAAVHADATNDRLELEYRAIDMTNQPFYFVGAYEVI